MPPNIVDLSYLIGCHLFGYLPNSVSCYWATELVAFKLLLKLDMCHKKFARSGVLFGLLFSITWVISTRPGLLFCYIV